MPLRLVLLTSLLCAAAVPAAASGFPRLGLYGCIRGTGFPYLIGSTDGPYDPVVFDAVARFEAVVLAASPISEYRPDVISELRIRNPDIKAFAYVLAAGVWNAQQPDSTVHFPTRYRTMLRNMDGFLYNKLGQIYNGGTANLTKKNGAGRFVVVDSIAVLFHDVMMRSGVWDGIFLDGFCARIGWTQWPGDSIDYVRAGFPTFDAFDQTWKTATDSLASSLRRLAGPEFILVGNCGPGTAYSSFNGWMRENFPWQVAGNWVENMYRDPGGYFPDDQRFRQPPRNFLFSWATDPANPYSADQVRKMRFGLGSAALGEGYGVFGPSNLDCMSHPYQQWWYDEFAVNLATRASSTNLAHTGWLGEALAPHYQMIWVGTAPDAVSNTDFEVNVTSGWTLALAVPASVTRDATTATRGVASARVHVNQSQGYESDVQWSTVNRLSVIAGQNYSATFWAKASQPRNITVVMGSPGVGIYGMRIIAITTAWKQYQVVMVPGQSATVGLQLFLGAATGDVWLDDVHFQSGTTTLYRRDFQNGIVLVNPGGTSLTVPLERQYYKLMGTRDPVTNNGTSVTSVTVPSNDALFLIGTDAMPPSGITDLRPTKFP